MTRLVVNVDGGARGNPGPAAIAAIVSTPAGEVLAERGEAIGEATNNVAEYRALLLGIRLAREHGADEVELIADSELIVRQVNGEYRVRDPGLRPLHAAVQAELAELASWSIRHVRREENAAADQLVNATLDADAQADGKEARMTRDEWLSAFAAELGGSPPGADEAEALLELAAIAAHASERTAAPLACWMAGRAGAPAREAVRAARAASGE